MLLKKKIYISYKYHPNDSIHIKNRLKKINYFLLLINWIIYNLSPHDLDLSQFNSNKI